MLAAFFVILQSKRLKSNFDDFPRKGTSSTFDDFWTHSKVAHHVRKYLKNILIVSFPASVLKG